MRILSLIHDEKDVIEEVLDHIKRENLTGLKKADIDQKCLDKIIPRIVMFVEQGMQIKRPDSAVLEDNIIEFRIPLPKSKYLLRIFAGISPPEIVLITWYLTKPHAYDDQWQKLKTDTAYKQHIHYAKQKRKEFADNCIENIEDIWIYFLKQ